VSPGTHGAAELGVERLYRIRGVENAPDLVGKCIERDDLSPRPAPALCDRRIAPPPEPVLEGGESRFSGFGVDGSIDVFQGCRDGLTVLVGDEVQAVAQQSNDPLGK
jgi:hypothetical protein